jgi:hypothetical protein
LLIEFANNSQGWDEAEQLSEEGVLDDLLGIVVETIFPSEPEEEDEVDEDQVDEDLEGIYQDADEYFDDDGDNDDEDDDDEDSDGDELGGEREGEEIAISSEEESD